MRPNLFPCFPHGPTPNTQTSQTTTALPTGKRHPVPTTGSPGHLEDLPCQAETSETATMW